MRADTPVDEKNDEFWTNLYNLLVPLARCWTFRAGVAVWKGQEWDVAEDIVQMAIVKIFQYIAEARRNNTPIVSLEHLSIVITKHCFLDLRRREMRLLHFAHDETELHEQPSLDLLVDPSQEAEEKLYEEWLLEASARAIAAFSNKLRAAILVDLANRSCFGEQPTALQQAFMTVGVCLQDYQRASSQDPAERARQSTLRSLAYKRLAQAHLN